MVDLHSIYDWYGLNTRLFRFVNELHAPVLDPLMLMFSALGHPNFYPFHLALAAWVSWRRPDVLRARNVVVFALAFVFVSALIVPVLKDVFDMPRPAAVLGDGIRVLGDPNGTHSFPSGHAAFATLLAWSLGPGSPTALRIALGGFAVLVCLSRIWVGAHFPMDVVAGALIAVAVVTAVRASLRGDTRGISP